MRFFLIGGLDESGRGAIAGPLVVAIVVFKAGKKLGKLKDSKSLSNIERKEIFKSIIASSETFGVGISPPQEIKKMGTDRATIAAAERAWKNLSVKPDVLLTDNIHLKLEVPVFPIEKADERCPAVTAASIVAKVIRDELMARYAALYPEFSLEQNKGYATPQHRRILARAGPSPIHRTK